MKMIFAELDKMNQHEPRKMERDKDRLYSFCRRRCRIGKITPCFENRKSVVFSNLTGGLGAGTTELHIVRPHNVIADYILIFLKSPLFIETGIPKMTGTAGQKRVPTDYFAHTPFPLPSLTEQKRIVRRLTN